jgi:hypothetical protein
MHCRGWRISALWFLKNSAKNGRADDYGDIARRVAHVSASRIRIDAVKVSSR